MTVVYVVHSSFTVVHQITLTLSLSPAQAARHMLGLQQVNFAGGPGKRRRRKRSREPLLIAVEAEQ